MACSKFRYEAAEYSWIISVHTAVSTVLISINEAEERIHEAEEIGAGEITEIRDLRKCIAKRLETIKLPVAETGANRLQMKKKVNITLKEYFMELLKKEIKILSLVIKNRKERENRQKLILEIAYWETEKITHWEYSIENLWMGILILIDAENEGIEEFEEIINLRKSINKRLEHLQTLDCVIETRFQYYVQYYINGYLMAQKLNASLTEYFYMAEDEKEKMQKQEWIQEMKKKVKEYLNRSSDEVEMDEYFMSEDDDWMSDDECLTSEDECLTSEDECLTSKVTPVATPTLGIISLRPGVENFNFILPELKASRMNLPAGASVIDAGESLPGGNLYKKHFPSWATKRHSHILNMENWAYFSKSAFRRKYSTISSERNSLSKVISMAKSTQTPCLLSAFAAVDKAAVFTFGGDDFRKPIPMTVNINVCSFFWRSCVDIFNMGFAYRRRRIPSYFTRRSFI